MRTEKSVALIRQKAIQTFNSRNVVRPQNQISYGGTLSLMNEISTYDFGQSIDMDSGGNDPMTLNQRKTCLRQRAFHQYQCINAKSVIEISQKLCKKLLTISWLVQSKHIALYSPIGKEINLNTFSDLINDKGSSVYYPRFCRSKHEYELVKIKRRKLDLITGYLGILEPKSDLPAVDESIKNDQLVWLVPGLLFDRKGNRLGRGKGYFDRILADVRGSKVGVAYGWQIAESIPSSKFDITMDYLVTEKDYLTCTG